MKTSKLSQILASFNTDSLEATIFGCEREKSLGTKCIGWIIYIFLKFCLQRCKCCRGAVVGFKLCKPNEVARHVRWDRIPCWPQFFSCDYFFSFLLLFTFFFTQRMNQFLNNINKDIWVALLKFFHKQSLSEVRTTDYTERFS